MKQLLNEQAPDPRVQEDWNRQRYTATVIRERHKRGIACVLLADEVGMGKTYTALAAIATHLFETSRNNRKALLVVPNDLLSAKWEQEIRTFNRDYLQHKGCKRLRPLVVGGYWDLVQNLHDYENVDVPRISETMLKSFAYLVLKWFDARRKRGKHRQRWAICDGLDDLHPDVLALSSHLSQLALNNYLDEQKSLEPERFDQMAGDLVTDQSYDLLKQLFRGFGAQQDAMEPNVYVVAMSKLRRAKSNNPQSKLFASYIVSRALKRRREQTRQDVIRAVNKSNLVCQLPDAPASKKKQLEGLGDWLGKLSSTNLWGFEAVADATIADVGAEQVIAELMGEHPGRCIKELSDRIVKTKLRDANFVLSVIDEVHNWKNGGNCAHDFAQVFREAIPNKLMMSATPFQLHQDELGRIFEFVAAEHDQSLEAVRQLIAPDGPASRCLAASARFQGAWGRLDHADVGMLQSFVNAHPNHDGASRVAALSAFAADNSCSEEFAAFVSALVGYHHSIRYLREDLSKVVIRHTKSRDKRHVHAGSDYVRSGSPNYAQPRSALYTTAGLGDTSAALLSYLGMRVEQRVRQDSLQSGKEAKAHLLSGFASSFSAFRKSNEVLASGADVSVATKRYLKFFESALRRTTHPKVSATVDRALANYRAGSKTLIFCERLATQDEIVQTLRNRIAAEDFQSIGIDGTKRMRRDILRDHLAVELYWSRSWQAAHRRSEKLIANQEEISAALERLEERLGRLNSRQRDKILDLLLLAANSPQSLCTDMFRGILESETALRVYLRLESNPELKSFDDDPDDGPDADPMADALGEITNGATIWHSVDDSVAMHARLWKLLEDECAQFQSNAGSADLSAFAHLLLDVGQGLRKVLLRLDTLASIGSARAERLGVAAVEVIAHSTEYPLRSPWHRLQGFLDVLCDAQGSIRRPQQHSSRRQSLWKGVYLRDEEIVTELHGNVKPETRISRCAAFNSPLLPDILVCTAIGSEGIDLHLNCDEIIHHDLPWNPARFEQRIGRIDRVGSLGERMYRVDPQQHRLDIGVPFLAFDYDEFRFKTLHSRAQKFEVLLGQPEFSTDVDERLDDPDNTDPTRADEDEATNISAAPAVSLPTEVLELIRIDLSAESNTP
ncbi:helicase-related protein [Niveibacterium sp. 24ML]|uniref:DEAD/DEAH box helicase n=1 Tax=Niveibacterium sp. 24ML TaxID=2985512 RepID=UPI00226ED847|nr:helicase-related protein [Niveibacterium sp. 24ML]MCX9157770.1 helicase-related protein [Niveibacterium sp. 24ML]